MRAAAPGKLVLSGAYAILYGAPAVVAAVSRYVVADASRPAEFVTPEVRAAVPTGPVPHFDASALRQDGQKLGLGSSAAIVVASLAALHLREAGQTDDTNLARAVCAPALAAHRRAQGGGSGVDVAAAAHGGVLEVTRSESGELTTTGRALPRGVHMEVWFSGQSTRTSDMVKSVRQLAASEPARFAQVIGAQQEASREAAEALRSGDAGGWLRGLARQCDALAALGDAAGVPIVVAAVRRMRDACLQEGGTVLPSGAGGGDCVLYAGPSSPGPALVELRQDFGYRPIPLRLGARGVHALSSGPADEHQ